MIVSFPRVFFVALLREISVDVPPGRRFLERTIFLLGLEAGLQEALDSGSHSGEDLRW